MKRIICTFLIIVVLILSLASCDVIPGVGDNGQGDENISLFEVDIDGFKNSEDDKTKSTFEKVQSVKLSNTTDYIIEVVGKGRGPSDVVIRVQIDKDGKIVEVKTLSHNELPIGSEQLEDGKYNSSFVGKTRVECEAVDIVAGCTITTSGFKDAVLVAFSAYEIINAK